MKKCYSILSVAVLVGFMVSGCIKSGDSGVELEVVEVVDGAELVYLPVVGGMASSFDKTPDWAPEPNPMGAADGDMLTRWSSDYVEGDQWITFDLGQESVVSDLVMKWERAHATEYLILASTDNASWQEVYHETEGKGGSMEASFAPVKCRYIKILAKKRVNEDWGISLWEVELYGPEENNPHATVTKSVYQNRADDTAEKEVVKNLLNKMKASAVSLDKNSFQKGLVFTSWMAEELSTPASDLALIYLKKLDLIP